MLFYNKAKYLCTHGSRFDGPIGIAEDPRSNSLSAYSRNRQLFIEMPPDTGNGGTLSVYNLLGQMILSSKLTEAPLQSVPLNSNDHGLVLLRLMTGQGIFSGKVLLD